MEVCLNELALFAGAGGGILGGKLLGWRTVCAVEIEGFPRDRLMQRQNEGHFEPFPIWDDVRTFDGRPWSGIVDVVSGGFPCQDISSAGKGRGLEGERSGLWGQMRRIICEVRPRFAFMENSPMLTLRGLDRVLGDLAELGFDANWGVLGCGSFGAPHDRERAWVLAWDSNGNHESTKQEILRRSRQVADTSGISWWCAEPGMDRMAHGMADRSKRNHAIGNGQVPIVAATAWKILAQEDL